MTKPKFNLGDEVADKVTGLKGIVVAYTKWITGCDTVTVQPQGLNGNGESFNTETLDVNIAELVKKKSVKIEKKEDEDKGCPRNIPSKKYS
jgi:hypothetical protein